MTNSLRLAFAACALLVSAQAWAEVYRCDGPDGRPVFVDRPCAGSVPTQRAPAAKAASMFTGNASFDLIRASALIDNMRTLGRDCEWALKVERNKSGACRAFMDKTSPTGELGVVGARLREITSGGLLADADAPELRRVNAGLRDVLRYREYAAAHMASR